MPAQNRREKWARYNIKITYIFPFVCSVPNTCPCTVMFYGENKTFLRVLEESLKAWLDLFFFLK